MDAFKNSCSRDAAQGARRAAIETYVLVDEEASTAQRREREGRYAVAGHPSAHSLRVDAPEKWIYKGVQHG
jgi:hypothetical protein